MEMTQQIKLLTPEANTFFDRSAYDYPFSSAVLEATLRFIAVTHSDKVEDVKRTEVFIGTFYGHNTPEELANSIDDEGIYVYEARNGAAVPTSMSESGWVSLDAPPYPVSAFLSVTSKTSVFLNAEKKKVMIFVKKATEKWVDRLTSSLFRMLPWIYPSDDSISENEKDLFKAINAGDADKFAEIINSSCEIDFADILYAKELFGWGDLARNSQITALRSRYDDYTSKIQNYEQSLNSLYVSLDGVTATLNALMMSENQPKNDVYQFFKNHKNIRIQSIGMSGGTKRMRYSVLETIEYFDQDAFKRLFDNEFSYFNNRASDIMKRVFEGLFIEEKGVIRTESEFYLSGVSSIEVSKTFDSNLDHTHFPHPHLYNYGCLGGNSDAIKRYLRDGDWDLAVEQTIAATKNINFGDSIVISSMIDNLEYRKETCRCIIADNGQEMTPREFYTYLEQEGEANG